MTLTRACGACGETLPLDQYDKDARGPQGRRNHCKPCRSAKMKAWYAANRERQVQRQRDRVAANPDKIRKQDRERYYRNREARIELVVESYHRRRALLKHDGADRGITYRALRKRDGDLCCYCHRLMSFGVGDGQEYAARRGTVEHVLPLSLGGTHTWDNVALACRECNVRKNARTPEQWAGPYAASPGVG